MFQPLGLTVTQRPSRSGTSGDKEASRVWDSVKRNLAGLPGGETDTNLNLSIVLSHLLPGWLQMMMVILVFVCHQAENIFLQFSF